ncbi:TBC1 domain family member 8B-like isoform X2 [Quillaja saponaria]|uniref:TBC1 domain family member 8B-like isoform X2 n=1 Tax=Quillaja saponaria TaxID=32244 RepID=A0AAD7Q8T9_QUISA|nr:TBC1 domain family member 8B-like isoform X2 [Quillaja saponaria]
MLLSLLSKRSLEVDSRDAYGFALRPQHTQRYREYANIYKEEECERSDKWRSFLEHVVKSPCSSEKESKETLNAEGTEWKEETVSERVREANDSSGRASVSDVSTGSGSEKEVHHSEERKTPKVQAWAEIRPSLSAIGSMMSSRVKKGKDMNCEQISISNESNSHLPSIQETGSLSRASEDDFDGEVCINKTLDDNNIASRLENDTVDEVVPDLFSNWQEELECLVHGGVPKDLRGEVWQAFVGVKTRRVHCYYEDLLAQVTNGSESTEPDEQDNSSGVPRKWRKQIEKDIPRTFPGHPALDENGRNSLRRLLLAYARHNPSVGYCQAMNFFAGLLLLLMPEENAFWTLVGIMDDYFEGYYTEEMIESQVDQLVFEELMRERFPKLVNHLDYLGVQVAWISGPWFLSIFVNMLPWESVLRIWDVLLFEGNRVMLFRTALALMELYGPSLVTRKDAGDAITLLQSLAGSTFDSSQLVLTACMGFLAVTEARLQELRDKHRPAVLVALEERNKKGRVWNDSKGLASKLYSFKHDPGSEERKTTGGGDVLTDEDSRSSDLDELLNGISVDSEADSLPDLQEQVVWLKVELCRMLEEKRSAVLRAEELETALMEIGEAR